MVFIPIDSITVDPLLQIHSLKLSNSETESSTGVSGCLSRHFVRMAPRWIRGGRTRVKCHMTFIACQRRARMRLFPLRACSIMFSSARALLSVSATGLSKPVQCYKSNTRSRVIVIHRKTNSNYHTFELTITVNEDYLSGL